MFSMILSGGQKLIDYIDMQMGMTTAEHRTLDIKDVSQISFHMNDFQPTELLNIHIFNNIEFSFGTVDITFYS